MTDGNEIDSDSGSGVGMMDSAQKTLVYVRCYGMNRRKTSPFTAGIRAVTG